MKKNPTIKFIPMFSVLIFLFILHSSLLTAANAVIVDVYQDCESGSNDDLLTSTIMNASNHGGGSWTTGGSLPGFVSTNRVRQLPGTVTVRGGATYTDSGTRTWASNDNLDSAYVNLNLGASYPHITIGCYLTVGPIAYASNNFDTIALLDGYYVVLQQYCPVYSGGPYIRAHSCTSGWSGTVSSNNIKVVAGKTYWVNLNYDGATNECNVAVFDPDTWTQVGNTVSCLAGFSTISCRKIRFGRTDAHGDNPYNDTQTNFDNILIDYTNAAFPLLPDTGGPVTDTTPPDNIATVNDGAGSDIDSTLSTTQLQANWTAATDNESSISRYDYCIGTSQGSANIVGWTSTINGTVTSVTESGLSLDIGTTYYFSVKAQSAGGTGNATSSDGQCVLGGGTGPGGDETPPVISNVNAGNITMTGATITWDTDEPATSRVEYGPSGYGNSTVEDNNLVTGHSVNLTSLIPGIKYHYRVISKDSSGNEKISIDYTFTTSGNELDARVYPSPYNPSKGSSMRFSIDSTAGGEVKIYTISGKLVKKLLIGAGGSDVNWDALNEEGNNITTGLYIYSITDGDGNKKTGKLVITQ
jgi:hypothetical protein